MGTYISMQHCFEDFTYIKMPRFLFDDDRYKSLSVTAKFTYALMLNRLNLSRSNGWANDNGEIYVIFTRAQIADAVDVSQKTASAIVSALVAVGLIRESRCGRGNANKIFISAEPFELSTEDGTNVDNVDNVEKCSNSENYDAKNLHVIDDSEDMNGKNVGSRHVNFTAPDANFLRPSKKDFIKKDLRKSSPSSLTCDEDETDATRDAIREICGNAEIEQFDDGIAMMIESSITALYNGDGIVVDDVRYTKRQTRDILSRIDGVTMAEIVDKIQIHLPRIRSLQRYLRTVIVNTVLESEAELAALSRRYAS